MTGVYLVKILCLISLEYFSNTECGHCEPGWIQWSEAEVCYLAMDSGSPRLNFSAANVTCWEQEASLISLSSPEEWQFLVNNGLINPAEEYWLGLTRDIPVSYHTSLATKRSGWLWLDGSNTSWINWEDGRPGFEEPTGESKCVKVSQNGLWYDHPCTSVMGFICEKKYSDITASSVAQDIDDTTYLPIVQSSTTANTVQDSSRTPKRKLFTTIRVTLRRNTLEKTYSTDTYPGKNGYSPQTATVGKYDGIRPITQTDDSNMPTTKGRTTASHATNVQSSEASNADRLSETGKDTGRLSTDVPKISARKTEVSNMPTETPTAETPNTEATITKAPSTDALQTSVLHTKRPNTDTSNKTILLHTEKWNTDDDNGVTESGNYHNVTGKDGLEKTDQSERLGSTWVMVISISLVCVIVLLIALCSIMCRRKRKKSSDATDGSVLYDSNGLSNSWTKDANGRSDSLREDIKMPVFPTNQTYASSLPTPQRSLQREESRNYRTNPKKKKTRTFQADYYNEPDVFPY